jgi:hypothetical protein
MQRHISSSAVREPAWTAGPQGRSRRGGGAGGGGCMAAKVAR